MLASVAADFVVILHFCFILFVIFGGLFVFRKPHIVWLHLPMMLWASVINYFGWTCPLTPLEKYFRNLSEQAAYHSSFIDHYLTPIVYPQGMSFETGVFLGVVLFVWNALLYASFLYRKHNMRRSR